MEIVNQLLLYAFKVFKQCLSTIHKSATFIQKVFFTKPAVPKLNTKFMADCLSAEFMGVGHEDANTRVR